MNERIKELYGKASEYGLSFTACNPNRTPEHFIRHAGQDLNEIIHEKFAELIVRECVNVNYNSAFKDGEFCARELLEHFGIEE